MWHNDCGLYNNEENVNFAQFNVHTVSSPIYFIYLVLDTQMGGNH